MEENAHLSFCECIALHSGYKTDDKGVIATHDIAIIKLSNPLPENTVPSKLRSIIRAQKLQSENDVVRTDNADAGELHKGSYENYEMNESNEFKLFGFGARGHIDTAPWKKLLNLNQTFKSCISNGEGPSKFLPCRRLVHITV